MGDAREHVFISPHLDDVVLSCGGLVQGLVGRGERVRAITVFARAGKCPTPSAFARHLHEKWGLRDSPAERLEEDRRAFRRLGVHEVEQWEYLDAPYRCSESGTPLYCTYDELKDNPAAEDGPLVEEVVQHIRRHLSTSAVARRLYFPLGLGNHVDHQLLFQVGLRLRALGWDVLFYEDWPYADAYEPAETVFGWMSETMDISVAEKHAAILEHRSQMPGLGGSAAVLMTRLNRYAFQVGKGHPQERYWFLTPTRAARLVENPDRGQEGPLRPKPQRRGFPLHRRILSRLRGVQLTQLLPRGSGDCLHLDGRDEERAAIEAQGYRCRSITTQEQRESIAPASAAAIVAWQPLDLAAAEQQIRDVDSLLAPGGVLVGRLSEGEATSITDRLTRYGFRDIQVRKVHRASRPGIVGLFRRRDLAFMARKSAVGARCTSVF